LQDSALQGDRRAPRASSTVAVGDELRMNSHETHEDGFSGPVAPILGHRDGREGLR
jgi:hypothetical protein